MKEKNLHSSITSSLLRLFSRTCLSTTRGMSRNTHRPVLLRYSATLAWTPGFPLPRTVNRTTLCVTRNPSTSFSTFGRRTRRSTTTWFLFYPPLLKQISPTTCFWAVFESAPFVENTVSRSTWCSLLFQTPTRLRQSNECTQKKNYQKKLLHAFDRSGYREGEQ